MYKEIGPLVKYVHLAQYLIFDPQVAQMMHAAGNDHLLTRLHYPDTGHLIEPPYSPHFRATNFIIESTKAKGEFYLHTRR